MNRCLSAALAALGLVALGTLPSCNAPSCGAGTKQVQAADGTLKCELADSPASLTPCDLDMGAIIVGGKCVGAVTCGPNTTLQNGQCVGTGGGGVPTCATPSPGTFCVAGAINNIVDGMPFSGAIHVSLYDPVAFLMNGAPLDQTDVTTPGYMFKDIGAPGLGLIIIVTGDADKMNKTFINTGTGAQGVSNGNKYRVDAYALAKTASDMWKPDIDIATGGAVVNFYYNEAKPAPTNLAFTEKTPVMGVQLVKDGAANPAGTRYFGTSMTMIAPTTQTTTTALGAAIVPSPVTGPFSTFSGMGGGTPTITWETLPGGSAPGVVVVTRFHPN